MLFPSGPLVVNSRFQVFPGSFYPVIIVYVVHVDPVSWHPTFLVILLGTPKPLLGLLDIVQGLFENLCEVFQEKVANTFWKFEVPVQRKPVESHTPCLVVSHMSNFVFILVLFLLFWTISLGKLRWVFCIFAPNRGVTQYECGRMKLPMKQSSTCI